MYGTIRAKGDGRLDRESCHRSKSNMISLEIYMRLVITKYRLYPARPALTGNGQPPLTIVKATLA